MALKLHSTQHLIRGFLCTLSLSLSPGSLPRGRQDCMVVLSGPLCVWVTHPQKRRMGSRAELDCSPGLAYQPHASEGTWPLASISPRSLQGTVLPTLHPPLPRLCLRSASWWGRWYGALVVTPGVGAPILLGRGCASRSHLVFVCSRSYWHCWQVWVTLCEGLGRGKQCRCGPCQLLARRFDFRHVGIFMSPDSPFLAFLRSEAYF